MKFKKFLFTLSTLFLIALSLPKLSATETQNPTENAGIDASCPSSAEGNRDSCTAKSQESSKPAAAADSGLEIEDIPKDQEPNKAAESTSTSNASANASEGPKKREVKFRSKAKKDKQEEPEENIDYPDDLQYQELFQKPGERRKYITSFTFKSNYTEFYDFNIDDEELDSIKKARITFYPPKRFHLNHQGNFLHFYKVAYEKGLPVYFTVDAMLYAVNENVNKLNQIFYEDILFNYLNAFYFNIINYANELMDSAEGEPHRYMISHAQLYFAVAAELLTDGFGERTSYPSAIDSQIKNFMTKIRKYELAEFYMFYNKKQINCSFLLPTGFFNRSKKLQNIHHSIKWFVSTKFLLDKKEINPIWYIGKLIVDSGNQDLYEKIHQALSFVMGQDSLTLSIVEIYNLGLELGYKDVFDLSDEQAETLVKKALEKKKEINLPFLNDNFFFSKEILEAFRIEREFSTALFTYQFDVEDWVKNKIIIYNPNSLRIMMSSFEITTAIHHASAYKEVIFNRYKGKKSYGDHEELIPLRDGLDLQEYFEKAKYSIKDLMNDHPENWRKSVSNHMHLIIYQASRRIRRSDPVYKMPFYKQKNFFTAYGSYIHAKREFAILKAIPEVKKTTGKFADVVVEPKVSFYEEVLELFKNYKNLFDDMKKFAEIKFNMNKNPAFSNLKFAFVNSNGIINHAVEVTEMLLDAINKQESGKMDEETKSVLFDLISFNKNYNAWMGWYTKLLDANDQEEIFNFYAWTAKVVTAPPVEDKKFNGAMIYTSLHYPHIGLIVKEDKFAKQRKLLIYPTYNAKETIKRFDPKINFDAEADQINSRD